MSSRDWMRRGAPGFLVVLLAAATLLPFDDALRLESGDADVRDRWAAALDRLPDDADVLVAFDPDLGTYAEVRPTVRAVLADLLRRRAGLAFVSLTPEGRALAVAELARLARAGANPRQLADFGFLPGAEAALVQLTRAFPEPRTDGALGRAIAAAGFAEVDAVLVIGGNDLGPRSWVEQVAPRVGDLPLLAVAPTVLLPELLPYVTTGQLEALAGTPRDGATVRAVTTPEADGPLGPVDGPSTVALLFGLVVAVLVLGQAVVAGIIGPREAR